MPLPDSDACYRAVASRDARFDGYFYTAVRTTGIYCRPSCPAPTPKRSNVEFYPTAAAAQERGFRACRRCRPEFAPGSPAWNASSDVAARAMRLIESGWVERDGVSGLADQLGYSPRHLTRILTSELGAGPLALARSARAATARTLLFHTTLSIAEVAFASGFGSVRQFNDSIRQIYGRPPSALRGERDWGPASSGAIALRLRARQPIDVRDPVGFLAARTIPGVEVATPTGYRRSLTLPGGPAILEVDLADGESVACRVALASPGDLQPAIARLRHQLDLDADPVAVDETLRSIPQLAPLVAARPGLRSPGAADGFELLIRAIVGQQISVAGARTVLGRMVQRWGVRLDEPSTAPPSGSSPPDPLPVDARRTDARSADTTSTEVAAPTWLFPTPEALAAADPAELPMPRRRGETIVAAAAAVAAGSLQLFPGADGAEVRARLLAMAGIGPWTAGYVAMRALGDPDIYLPQDLVARTQAARLGIDEHTIAAAAPWRSYLTHHLWRSVGQKDSAGKNDDAGQQVGADATRPNHATKEI